MSPAKTVMLVVPEAIEFKFGDGPWHSRSQFESFDPQILIV